MTAELIKSEIVIDLRLMVAQSDDRPNSVVDRFQKMCDEVICFFETVSLENSGELAFKALITALRNAPTERERRMVLRELKALRRSIEKGVL